MAASKRDASPRAQRLGQGLAALKHWKAAAQRTAPPPPPVAPAPPPGPTDQDLLRAALAAVSPLDGRHSDRHLASASSAATADQRERQRRLRDHASLTDEPSAPSWSDLYEAAGLPDGADHQYLASGQPADILSRLRRGQWAIHASVDLHGSTLDDARQRLDRFLASCLAHDMRCVRVIHGQGHGSEGQPVLRRTVRRWLAQLPAVQAFVECAPGEGGAGALRVLLRPARAATPPA